MRKNVLALASFCLFIGEPGRESSERRRRRKSRMESPRSVQRGRFARVSARIENLQVNLKEARPGHTSRLCHAG